MVEETVKQPHSEWSPLLRRVALDDTRWPSSEAVQRLTDQDVHLLRRLAEEMQPTGGIRQDKVLTALSERAPDAETAKVLEHVIGDRERRTLLRMAAAIGLGRLPAVVSEKILLAHVADNVAPVAQRVIQSLGRMGGMEGLNKLEAMEPPRSPYVRRQWEFSTRLIRHRLGVRGKEAPRTVGTTWATERDRKPLPLPMGRLVPDRLKAIIAGLRGEVFGVELAGDRGYEMEADRSLQYFLIAQALTTRDGLQRLGEVPMVAALIAMWEQRTSKPLLDQIALTEPFDDGVLVQGFRQDGALMFEGRAVVRAGAASFTVVSTDSALRCRFRVAGELKPEGLAVRGETLARRKPLQTQPLLGAVR